ncbi:hypothetical protein E5288_WYG007156 [Bos mutus]|uniref:Immediate early response 3-interacting protein 1 n=1 Tax=Bos mutus TaxID=72004 RepID=A0A6B0QQ65_9CETA|nr:hypothetical protein [Bos mutus]
MEVEYTGLTAAGCRDERKRRKDDDKVSDNFQDQMKRELAYREEMVQQLQIFTEVAHVLQSHIIVVSIEAPREAALLCVNAIAVLHEERFLKNIGWGTDQGIGGFGEEPGIKSQLMNLIRSVRTVMRVPLIIVNSIAIVLLLLFGTWDTYWTMSTDTHDQGNEVALDRLARTGAKRLPAKVTQAGRGGDVCGEAGLPAQPRSCFRRRQATSRRSGLPRQGRCGGTRPYWFLR